MFYKKIEKKIWIKKFENKSQLMFITFRKKNSQFFKNYYLLF